MNELEIINGICSYSLKLCYSYKEARTLINKFKNKSPRGLKQLAPSPQTIPTSAPNTIEINKIIDKY